MHISLKRNPKRYWQQRKKDKQRRLHMVSIFPNFSTFCGLNFTRYWLWPINFVMNLINTGFRGLPINQIEGFLIEGHFSHDKGTSQLLCNLRTLSWLFVVSKRVHPNNISTFGQSSNISARPCNLSETIRTQWSLNFNCQKTKKFQCLCKFWYLSKAS